MRKNTSQKGFTLIELLIVIAIIGILAAVLIPNLLSARQMAQDRAAQTYSSQVYTAINAWLASSSKNVLGTGDGWNGTCGGEYTVGDFTVNDPGAAVPDDGCTITVGSEEGDEPLEVAVTSVNGKKFVNGQEDDGDA